MWTLTRCKLTMMQSNWGRLPLLAEEFHFQQDLCGSFTDNKLPHLVPTGVKYSLPCFFFFKVNKYVDFSEPVGFRLMPGMSAIYKLLFLLIDINIYNFLTMCRCND